MAKHNEIEFIYFFFIGVTAITFKIQKKENLKGKLNNYFNKTFKKIIPH